MDKIKPIYKMALIFFKDALTHFLKCTDETCELYLALVNSEIFQNYNYNEIRELAESLTKE